VASILSFAPETAIDSSHEIIIWMEIARWQLQTLGTRFDDAEKELAIALDASACAVGFQGQMHVRDVCQLLRKAAQPLAFSRSF